jgi:voltage-gated potassium channel
MIHANPYNPRGNIPPMNREKLALYWDILMIALALLTVFLLFYEMTISPEDVARQGLEGVRAKVILIHRLDFWICMVFIGEFFVRLWKEKDRRVFFKMHWLEIPGMIPFTIFNVSRTIRILRLFRLVRVYSLLKRFSRLYKKRFVRNELQYAFLVLVTILLLSTFGVYLFESRVNPEIESVGDAFWWSIVTVTTVGYGDKVPITPLGKVIGVILMFTGIGLIGVLSGTIASYLMRGYKADKGEDVEEALRILTLRRAKGEVTEEQYQEIRKDLEGMIKAR